MSISKSLSTSFISLLFAIFFVGVAQQTMAAENLMATVKILNKGKETTLVENLPLNTSTDRNVEKGPYKVYINAGKSVEFAGKIYTRYAFKVYKKSAEGRNTRSQSHGISSDMLLRLYEDKERYSLAEIDGDEFILIVTAR